MSFFNKKYNIYIRKATYIDEKGISALLDYLNINNINSHYSAVINSPSYIKFSISYKDNETIEKAINYINNLHLIYFVKKIL